MSTISATLVRGARPLGNTIPCGRCGIPRTRRPERPHTLCADCRDVLADDPMTSATAETTTTTARRSA